MDLRVKGELVWILHLAAYLSALAYFGFGALFLYPALRKDLFQLPWYVFPFLVLCFIVLSVSTYYVYKELQDLKYVNEANDLDNGEDEDDDVVEMNDFCYDYDDWYIVQVIAKPMKRQFARWKKRRRVLLLFVPPRRSR
eukprot:GEMP01050587.1.p1 GENE.GEMP01050587.1~~GEMP01050587.1.p1  ORF type:complete len:139 (-),score=39.11 GEMP01050587.1:1016-1432(-)